MLIDKIEILEANSMPDIHLKQPSNNSANEGQPPRSMIVKKMTREGSALSLGQTLNFYSQDVATFNSV